MGVMEVITWLLGEEKQLPWLLWPVITKTMFGESYLAMYLV
jgi:hypothetical protein